VNNQTKTDNEDEKLNGSKNSLHQGPHGFIAPLTLICCVERVSQITHAFALPIPLNV